MRGGTAVDSVVVPEVCVATVPQVHIREGSAVDASWQRQAA